MAHAFDTPAPATIILISGDRDFVYAVSILALRRYRMVVINPKCTHIGLKNSAEAVYQWPDDFLSDSSRTGIRDVPGPGERETALGPHSAAGSQPGSSSGSHRTDGEKMSTSHILVSRTT